MNTKLKEALTTIFIIIIAIVIVVGIMWAAFNYQQSQWSNFLVK